MKKDKIWTPVLACVFLVGCALLLYPPLAGWWNARAQSRVIASYDASITAIGSPDYSAYFEAAEKYNTKLREIGSAAALASPKLVSEESGKEYEELLDVAETGVMGYVSIEKIEVRLPIYHGTDAGVLQSGAGHLEGSSLPVGGEGTHCVLAAHRGMPGAKLFTDIDQLEVGDSFTVTVLDREMTYQVDQILVVLPDEIEELYIEDGKDYCTLMTCTPYGVNTHRLLVRGVRVTDMEEAEDTVAAMSVDNTGTGWSGACQLPAALLTSAFLTALLIGVPAALRKNRKKEG